LALAIGILRDEAISFSVEFRRGRKARIVLFSWGRDVSDSPFD
jgi:hypothetical protein